MKVLVVLVVLVLVVLVLVVLAVVVLVLVLVYSLTDPLASTSDLLEELKGCTVDSVYTILIQVPSHKNLKKGSFVLHLWG